MTFRTKIGKTLVQYAVVVALYVAFGAQAEPTPETNESESANAIESKPQTVRDVFFHAATNEHGTVTISYAGHGMYSRVTTDVGGTHASRALMDVAEKIPAHIPSQADMVFVSPSDAPERRYWVVRDGMLSVYAETCDNVPCSPTATVRESRGGRQAPVQNDAVNVLHQTW